MSSLVELPGYASAFEAWLATGPDAVAAAAEPTPSFETRVSLMSNLMATLFHEGWGRYGWPEAVGGLGGTILHRAAMWEALARYGVPGMALYEHLEVLAPTLVALGPPAFLAEAMPRYLAGKERWAQGFSEPGAGSDLASLRTRAVPVDGGYAISGRKIWTSWARYATWCLVLARTGTVESRHRGLTAFIVDLRSPGVEVHAITQANGTDELAEVSFDEVHVSADRIVGELDGGWAVAMHILSHERGTFAWFHHLFLHQHLAGSLGVGDPADDSRLGDAVLDLAATTATSYAALRAHESGRPLGPRAAFTKLLLCEAERSTFDWILANDGDLALGLDDPEIAVQRQGYLFSRIVTVYGGSQQMQLETIAKQVVKL